MGNPSHPHYQPPKPPFECGVSKADVADINLIVTINGNAETESQTEVKQMGIYEKTASVNDSIDVSLFIPLKGIESGNIG